MRHPRTPPWAFPLVLAVSIGCGALFVARVDDAAIGVGASTLALIPVGATGWLWGPGVGLAVGILAVPVVSVLFGISAGGGPFGWLFSGGAPVAVAIVAAGWVLGEARRGIRRARNEHAQLVAAERRLRDSEDALVRAQKADLLEHVARSVGIGVAIVEPDGSLAHVNPSLREMVAAWPTPGAWWVDAAVTTLPGTACAECGMPRREGRRTVDLARPDGAQQAFEVVFAGHGHGVEGAERRDLALVRDVTIEVRIQERLERMNHLLGAARDDALAASRAKSAFLANMSHELRTPLNTILGYTDMLREDARDHWPDAVVDLDHIKNQGHHLLTLISDILDLSKIEAGRMELHPAPCDLPSLLYELEASTRPLAVARGNRLVVQRPEILPDLVCDHTRIRQVLTNLLSNACKFTEDGSITLLVEREGTDVLFAVRDTGIGMDSKQVSGLFAEFYQGDASATRAFEGTGLGLAISKRFVEMMGGRIEVDSEPGRGSEFRVILPSELTETTAVTAPPREQMP